MNLTPEQKIYLDNELYCVSRALLDEYYAERERNGFTQGKEYGWSTDQIAAVRARRLAKDLAEARSTKFREVFSKFDKFPDEEEYSSFVEESRCWIVDKNLTLFDETCAHIFASSSSAGVIANIRQGLATKLQSIYAHGLEPVTSFLDEGKANHSAHMSHSGDGLDDAEGTSPLNVYHISGDYVTGSQIKAGDNNQNIQRFESNIVQPDVKRRWNWGTILTLIAVFVAIGIGISAFAVPEVRQFVCDRFGILCKQTP